jgi:hypothetical protein
MNEPPKLPPLLVEALAKSRQLGTAVEQWRERYRQQLERLSAAVAGYRERTRGWFEEHGPQIEAVLQQLLELNREADSVEREWRDAGLGYLVSPLGMAEKLVVSLHAGPGDEAELLDFLEACLADDEVIASISEYLNESDVLSEVPRAHLLH